MMARNSDLINGYSFTILGDRIMIGNGSAFVFFSVKTLGGASLSVVLGTIGGFGVSLGVSFWIIKNFSHIKEFVRKGFRPDHSDFSRQSAKKFFLEDPLEKLKKIEKDCKKSLQDLQDGLKRSEEKRTLDNLNIRNDIEKLKRKIAGQTTAASLHKRLMAPGAQ